MFERFYGEPRASDGLSLIAEHLEVTAADLAPTVAASINIQRNRIAQVLIVGAAQLWWRALSPLLPDPLVILGYSVGELSAHAISGSIAASDALRLASSRASAMDECVRAPQAMLALPHTRRVAAEEMAAAHGLHIAIRNGPSHHVLGGLREYVIRAFEAAEAVSADPRLLPVEIASHTPLMLDAVGPFQHALRSVHVAKPQVTVLAGIDASVVRTPDEVTDTLARQLAITLEWQRCLEIAVERGVTCFLELGPGRALSRMAAELFPEIPSHAAEEFQSVEGLARWVNRRLDAA
jgi:[acyl-carrier-protein] S-malonyltransferase